MAIKARWLIAAALVLGCPSTSLGQSLVPVQPYNGTLPVSGSNPLPVSGSFSASLSGFLPSVTGSRGTPITVTTADSSGLLPTGTVVDVSNTGINPMYCNVTGLSATTADKLIAPSSWFEFTIPSTITVLHCIATGGSTTATMVGGMGLGTGAGGGSGSGGGGLSVLDSASWTAGVSFFTPLGGEFNSSPQAIASGSQGTLAMGSTRHLLVTEDNSAAILSALGTAPNPATASAWGLLAQASSTSGQLGSLTMGAVTSAAPSYSNGNTSPLSLDTSGNLRIGGTITAVQPTGSSLHMVCDSGCSAAGSPGDESTFTFGTSGITPVGGAYQTTATSNPLTSGQMGAVQLTINRAMHINVRNSTGTELGTSGSPFIVGGSGTAGSPSANVVTVQGVSSMTPFLVNPGTASLWGVVTQGSTTSGQSGNLVQGAVTSAAPTYSNAQTSPLSLDTAGNLRVNVVTGAAGSSIVDQAAFTQGTTTETQTGGLFVTTCSGGCLLSTGTSGALRATNDRKLMIDQPNVEVTQSGATAAASAIQIAGVFNTLSPTYTNGQGGALQMTAAGSLHTTVDNTATVTGSGSAGTAAAGVITVQGITSMTPVQVSQATPANLNATVSQATGTNLHVVCDSGCSSAGSPTDLTAFTGGSSTFNGPVGGFFQTSATSHALTNNTMGAFQVTANRALFVNLRDSSGNEEGLSGQPLQVTLANTGSNATAVLVTGTGGAFPATQSTNPWIVAGGGTAGSAASGVVTVQGIASMTPILANPGTAANWGIGATGSAAPANAVYIGANSTTGTTGGLLKGMISCDSHVFKHITTATDTLAIQGVASQSIYICGWRSRAAGIATWYLENTASTNANCSSTLTQLTGVASETTNSGETMLAPYWTGLKNTSGNGLCINSTGTGGVDIDIFYVQY